MPFWLMVMLLSLDTRQPTELIDQRQYLDAGLIIQPQARELNDPSILRQYVVLLTEYYAKQVGFRSFFLKNLRPGESLILLRSTTSPIAPETAGKLLEPDLETLLNVARQRHPEDLNVRFAIAQFLYRGRCCSLEPTIEMTPTEGLAVFKEAEQAGIRSPGSMLALALEALARGKRKQALTYFEQGLTLNPADEDLTHGYMNELIGAKRYGDGLVQARKLFEIAEVPEMKALALTGAARALAAADEPQEALDTATSALKILPSYNLAFYIGLDILRDLNRAEEYAAWVTQYLDQRPEEPALFLAYLEYLSKKGVRPIDETFFAAYRQKEYPSLLARITRNVNLATFELYRENRESARLWLVEARKLADKLSDRPPDMDTVLEEMLKRAEGR
jgi:tetratricopeptide (TPR) repeat protein